MSWQETDLANPMGYARCVLFESARAAMQAYIKITGVKLSLPENVCPEVVAAVSAKFEEIDQTTGLADLPVHLYGYQADFTQRRALTIDPLMTGWRRQLKTLSAIVSFGRKKVLSIGYGGALLTNDGLFAEEIVELSRWNTSYTQPLITALDSFSEDLERRWYTIDLWDQYLGDLLIRIPKEQIMPWRAMRQAPSAMDRMAIVQALRKARLAIGTNYPPVLGDSNHWGDTVLNFPCTSQVGLGYIQRTAEIIEQVING